LLVSEICDEEEAVGRGGGRGGNRSIDDDDDDFVGLVGPNSPCDVITPLQDDRTEGSDAVNDVLVASLISL
jgi:hypothetical protein